MSPYRRPFHWAGRAIGAVLTAGAVFVLLSVLSIWDFPFGVRIIISVVFGVLFLIFGGRVWRVIDEANDWW